MFKRFVKIFGELEVKSVLALGVEIKEPTFPVLCKYKESDFTVMFNDYTCGTVVHSNESEVIVGTYRSNWYKWNDKKYWEVLPKGTTVTLIQ